MYGIGALTFIMYIRYYLAFGALALVHATTPGQPQVPDIFEGEPPIRDMYRSNAYSASRFDFGSERLEFDKQSFVFESGCGCCCRRVYRHCHVNAEPSICGSRCWLMFTYIYSCDHTCGNQTLEYSISSCCSSRGDNTIAITSSQS